MLWTLYLVWDWLKSFEYKGKALNVFWSVPYLIMFLLIAVFHFMPIVKDSPLASSLAWVELGVLFLTVFVYRLKQPIP
jgi:hypothetical protein